MDNKIFHISMTKEGGKYYGYDTYSDFVIIAKTEERAREMCSCGDECNDYLSDKNIGFMSNGKKYHWHDKGDKSQGCFWKDPEMSEVVILGTTKLKEQMVCSSFHAG